MWERLPRRDPGTSTRSSSGRDMEVVPTFSPQRDACKSRTFPESAMNTPLRIAVGQISSESNHFVASRCDVDFFRTTGYLHEGDELFRLRDSETEIGGILVECRASKQVEVVPLLATRGNSDRKRRV